MGTTNLSASAHVGVLSQGKNVDVAIRVTGQLAQSYNTRTQRAQPDWQANPSLRPSLTPELLTTATNPIWLEATWRRDGTPIATLAGVSSGFTDDYDFDSTTLTLTIKRNLAGPDNLDPDLFSFSGKVEIDGVEHLVKDGRSATILPASANGYSMGIGASNGTTLSQSVPSTQLTAYVYVDGVDGSNGLYYYWYKNVDTAPLSGGVCGLNKKTLTVNRSDVNGAALYRCEAWDREISAQGATCQAVASIPLEDKADLAYVSLVIDKDITGDDAAGVATGTLQLWKRANAADAEWTPWELAGCNFTVKVFDNADQDMIDLGSGVTDSEGKGTFTISKSQMRNAGTNGIKEGDVVVDVEVPDTIA